MRSIFQLLPSILTSFLAISCSNINPETNSADQEMMTEISSFQCLDSKAVAHSEILGLRVNFNRAISERDMNPIRNALSETVILITGTDSAIFSGRQAQLDIWAEDFASEDPLIYIRTPSCIVGSDFYPIALEHGHWVGAKHQDEVNSLSGVYSAKWRQTDGSWKIESETYLTTDCSGSLCPR